MFVGTGCQVAGVLSSFAKHPNRDRLYTIDLICGGVPSNLLMQSFLENHPEVESITSFRTKRKYELKGIVAGKEVTLPQNALPLAGFKTEQTNRYVCYNCPFAKAHRQSDVTIGDLWGDCSPASQREQGVSLVIVHSEKGRQLLQKSDVTYQRLEWEKILQANKRLVYGRTPKSWLRDRLADNYKRMDGATFARIYSLSSSLKQPSGFAARVWIYIQRKLNTIQFRSAVKEVLRE